MSCEILDKRFLAFPPDFDFIAREVYAGQSEDCIKYQMDVLKGLGRISQGAIDFFLEVLKNRPDKFKDRVLQ